MTALPPEFIEKMKKQLPEDEWEAFFAVYGEETASRKGLRVNALKCTGEEFLKISPFPLRPVAWEKNGFYAAAEKIGAHPYHFAGLYYSQEPSAMCAAPLLDAQPGERVLDLCSAPGGKGTQLAAAMKGEGLLVLNEPVYARAQILSGNAERMGIRNAVVLSAAPEKLASFFGEYFDKILVDAPCSGEGMFRKNAEEARGEWSEKNVKMCAERQKGILSEATKLLKAGGRLVYSTCTFSTEEDEGQVCDYLKNHPEMRLVEMKKLYPHKIEGEGHFAALFEKNAGGESRVRPLRPEISRESEKLYREFEKRTLAGFSAGNLLERRFLYSLPEGMFDSKTFSLLRAGIRLGEVTNGRFEPSHSLAMCLKKEECGNVFDLRLADARAEKFLRGETIETEENRPGQTLPAGEIGSPNEKLKNGWCLVCIEGYPVGWGKAVNGTIKNHIPKALRKRS